MERALRVPRRLVRVLIAVVLVALVVWGLDWLARIEAQSLIARSVQQAEHLADRPSVTVRGWFFLPQLISGDYQEVDITVHDLQDGQLRLATVTAHLYGAHVSLDDVVNRSVTTVPVDRTDEQATLTYPDLNAYLAARGEPVTLGAGPPGQVKITMHTKIFGRGVSVSADARVRATPGALRITPTQLDTGNALLDAVSRIVLGGQRSITIPTTPLPFGQHVTAISVGRTQLTVGAAGQHVRVAEQKT